MSQGHDPAGADADDADGGVVASSGAREVTGSTAGPPVDVGDVIDGRYELRDRLGAGGMGYVFGGIDRRLQRPVAVKVIRSELAENRMMARRFEREALASSQLTSPYVVVVYDFGTTEDGVPYLVMERLNGETLSRAIKRAETLPVAETLQVATDIARALVAAHGRGIVHRDLKPDNVFLTDDGPVKVLDFGIAKILQPEGAFGAAPSLTSTGMMLGTPLYMSPESVRKKSEVGPPSDMYSFGSILFRMLTGRPVFVHDEPVVVLSMHVQRTPAKLSDVRRDVAYPPALEALVDALLRKDPAERPTAAEALEQVEAMARDLDRHGPLTAPGSDATPLHDGATAILALPEARGAQAEVSPPSDAFAPSPERTAQTPAPPMDEIHPPAAPSTPEPVATPPPTSADATEKNAPIEPTPAPAVAEPTPAPGSPSLESGEAPAGAHAEPSSSSGDPFSPLARSAVDTATPPTRGLSIGLLAAGTSAIALVVGVVVAMAWMVGGEDSSELTATELPHGPRPAGASSNAAGSSNAAPAEPTALAATEPQGSEAQGSEAQGGAEPSTATPREDDGAADAVRGETPAASAPRETPDDEARPEPARAGEPGRLRIDTDGPAEVFVDGERRGTAPLELELPPGSHRVVLEADGRRRRFTVRLAPGRTVRRRVAIATRAPSPSEAPSEAPSPEEPSALPELPSQW